MSFSKPFSISAIEKASRRAGPRHARNLDRPAMHGADRGPRRRRRFRSPARPAHACTASTQMPHIIAQRPQRVPRASIRDSVRIVAPDVGGGFGYKGILLARGGVPRLARDALRLPGALVGGSARASERRRQLPRAPLPHHRLRRSRRAPARNRLRGHRRFRRLFLVSLHRLPRRRRSSPAFCPGPYDFPAYRCRTYSVATNKCPILPYRGVARTGVCFALELVLDAVAREVGLEPAELRRRNLVRPEQMPFDNITRQALRQRRLSRSAAPRDGEHRSRRRFGSVRRAANPTAAGSASASPSIASRRRTALRSMPGWGIPMVPGFEQAQARLTPDGGLEIRVGVHSHGQGLETTLAQVAHEILGDRHREASASFMATPRSRPIPPAPGDRAAW